MSEILTTTILEGSPIIYFLKGLPASGKSTWAKSMICNTTVRINKDTMRLMLGSEFSRKLEAIVIESCRATGINALKNGFNVIIDDTNLNPKYFNFWEAIAKQRSYGLKEIFFDTPVDVCIARDSLRSDKVGEAVIRDMYKKYCGDIAIKPMYAEQDFSLPPAVIIDIDGTMAIMNDRGPFDLSKVKTDLPNTPVIELVKSLRSEGNIIIFVSGRKNVSRIDTESWLVDHLGFLNFKLFMRHDNDNRADQIVKKELYDMYIHGNYYVRFILDDRNSVVDMWRKELNLPCFQVNYGDF